MTEMSMNVAIHRAIRRDLGRFDRALDKLAPGDRALAARIATAWAQLDDQLTYHHEGEHEIAFPTFTALGVEPNLLEAMETEHQAMAAALSDARGMFAALGTSPDQARIEAARAALREVEAATVVHLDHEEAELEPIYQAKKNTDEIKAMLKKFSRASPPRAGRFFAWITDGADPEAQATVEREVPAPVRAVIGGVFGRGYRKDIAPLWAEVG